VVAAPRRPIDRIARITTLHERGETDQAVAALKQITSDSPDYERAQLLLTEWESPAEAAEVPEEEQVQAWTALIGRAREAYAAGEYLSAASLFNRASAVAPLEGAEAGLFEDSKRQLEPILQMVGLYRQRQYEMALPTLWRYREENPGNQDVRRLLINSYYNLAVRALRQAQPKRAVALAQEAVTLDQDDAYAQRLLLFAQSYDGAPSDLLYDIFINNLEIRP
jgi:tetratricopeptide (TPR) repeat protein